MSPFLINDDAYRVLPDLEPGSVDLIILDLPYSRTAAAWDQAVDIPALWSHLRRILTPIGTVLAFGTQPFTTQVAAPAIDLLKYGIIWRKNRPTGHFHARNRPLSEHEDILVFSHGAAIHEANTNRRMVYHPVGGRDVPSIVRPAYAGAYNAGGVREGVPYDALRDAPRSILTFPKDSLIHTSAKPVALLEWLIAAYSDPDATVLDPTMGSGSTVIAAQKLGRWAIGIERDPNIFETAERRIAAEAMRDIAA